MEKELILEEARSLAEKIKGFQDFRYHDSYFRKTLYTTGESVKDFELLRAEITIKRGRAIITRNVVIYPSDVVYYVRRTLAVVEDIVDKKVKEKLSFTKLEDYCFSRYEIKSIKPILQAMRRVKLAFERLLTTKAIVFSAFAEFIAKKTETLTRHNQSYQKQVSEAGLGLLGLFRI